MNVCLLKTIKRSYQCTYHLAGTALEINEKHEQVNDLVKDLFVRNAS